MSFGKTVKATYHVVEATSDEYYDEVSARMKALIKSGEVSGSFDTSDSHYVWKINEVLDIASSDTFFISLAKERAALPIWFNDEGEISEIPKNNGMIGELFYAFFNPMHRFMILMAATTGAGASSFKKFLNEFSGVGIKLIPFFENAVDKKVLNWDYYKKLSLAINFPAHDDLAEFKTTKEGSFFQIVDELGGLKIDVNVSATKPNQMLNAYQVKEMLASLISYELCSKLIARGGEFEKGGVEDQDIKNAQMKYTEKVVVQNSYVPLDEAKLILLKALEQRQLELLGV